MPPAALSTIDESSSRTSIEEAFTESLCVSCNTEFTPPTSTFMIMHWVRALIHMYCISFQQLERELINMQNQYGSTSSSSTSKTGIASTLLHMMHAWCMLSRCIDSPAWRCIAGHAMDGVTPSLYQWYRDMPHVSDREYAKRELSGTCTTVNYPRMAKGDTNSVLVDGFPKLGEDSEDPYFIPADILYWVIDTIHRLPVSSACITMLKPPLPTGASAVQTVIKSASLCIPHNTLTCLTMPKKFLTTEQYWFLVMCIQSLPPSSPVIPSYCIKVKKVCSGTIYHMYSPGGAGNYDNLRGATSGLMAWSAVAHAAKAAKKCIKGKRTRVYLSLWEDSAALKCPSPVSKQSVQQDMSEGGALWELPVRSRDAILSWKRRSKVNSIGHIVVGWVAKSLASNPITSRGWE